MRDFVTQLSMAVTDNPNSFAHFDGILVDGLGSPDGKSFLLNLLFGTSCEGLLESPEFCSCHQIPVFFQPLLDPMQELAVNCLPFGASPLADLPCARVQSQQRGVRKFILLELSVVGLNLLGLVEWTLIHAFALVLNLVEVIVSQL